MVIGALKEYLQQSQQQINVTIIPLLFYTRIQTLNNEFHSMSKKFRKGGSPGLVVMGINSRSKGCGFESRRRILDGHDIFHIDLL